MARGGRHQLRGHHRAEGHGDHDLARRLHQAAGDQLRTARSAAGGKGVIGARTKDEDFVEHLFVANTHAYLLILTDKGRCYWLKVHEIEQAGRVGAGRPLVNHLEGLARDERVQAVVPVKEFDDQHFLVCATRRA